MKLYIGNTDYNWFSYLKSIDPEDVNFWQPGGKTTFKVLNAGAPFLFRLKSPRNKIAGIGFFSSHTFLPISIAWDTFHNRNGCESLEDLRKMVAAYRSDFWDFNPTIGCIVLTNPIFFDEDDWISVPADWSNSIVQGKSYETTGEVGAFIWSKVSNLFGKYKLSSEFDGAKSQLILEDVSAPGYRESILSKVRLGQGAFRVLITDAYSRRCSISGEKTLPVLEAAHIKPYAKSGPHFISNGLLLRSDLHKLFDQGYLTVSPELKVEVSSRIKLEFENGKDYYKFHGNSLVNLPFNEKNKPNLNYIDWHNSNIFKG